MSCCCAPSANPFKNKDSRLSRLLFSLMRPIRVNLISYLPFVLLVGGATSYGDSVEWVRQLGTPVAEEGYGLSVDDSNNIVVTGRTRVLLPGVSAGLNDVFLAKYTNTGELVWMRQFGTVANDFGCSISTDNSGNAYVGGYTYGNLAGVLGSKEDAFVAKYDAAGNRSWIRQFGTRTYNPCFDVATDTGGNVYAAGNNYDFTPGTGIYNNNAFLRKYDASGNAQWTSQLALPNSDAKSIATDGLGYVYMAGEISHSEVFISKYDASGNALWCRKVSSTTWCGGVEADRQGNVYVSGSSYVGNSLYDAFLAKYDANGNQLWSRLFDSGGSDTSYGLALAPGGGVYLNDQSDGNLFVVMVDPAGNPTWSESFGTSEFEIAYSCVGRLEQCLSNWPHRRQFRRSLSRKPRRVCGQSHFRA